MNNCVCFETITNQNRVRFRYYQRPSHPCDTIIHRIPIWLDEHYVGCDTGMLATYFHSTIRNHIGNHPQTATFQLV